MMLDLTRTVVLPDKAQFEYFKNNPLSSWDYESFRKDFMIGKPPRTREKAIRNKYFSALKDIVQLSRIDKEVKEHVQKVLDEESEKLAVTQPTAQPTAQPVAQPAIAQQYINYGINYGAVTNQGPINYNCGESVSSLKRSHDNIAANESTASTAVLNASSAAGANVDEHFDDPFAKEPECVSPLVQRDLMRNWKKDADYQPKLHLQDLMFYSIADFTSGDTEDGTHYVYGNKLDAEKRVHKVEHKQRKEIAHHARELLKSSSQGISLKERLKSNKEKALLDKNCHTVYKICKVYVQLEKDQIYLYTGDVNETTNLMCHIRPLIMDLLRPLELYEFQWAEAALRCKKIHENKILMTDGACTTPTKIDGIIIDKEFDMEVAVLEISGPNNKVNTTHYLEDKKKTAKNLRYMYEFIMAFKSKPCLEAKASLKVYGFHIYLNSLIVYSLKQPTLNGPYIFQQELAFQLVNTKVVVPVLPDLVSNLWQIRDILEQQHDQLKNFIYDEDLTPDSSIGGSDQEEAYISPRKRTKVQKK